MPRPAVLLTLRFCEMLWATGGKKLLTAEFAEKIRRGRREKPLALFSPRSQRLFSAFSAVKGFLFGVHTTRRRGSPWDAIRKS